MLRQRTLSGINIQYPISQLIINKEKIVETRTYPLPDRFISKEFYLIETPGKKGKFKSRIVGIIKFTESFKYKNKKQFYEDSKRHKVTKDSEWKWTEGDKWGWDVVVVEKFDSPIEFLGKKGIIYTHNITVPNP